MASPRVFLGGVPFGCDNIGDEAILASIVRIVQEECPQARITVSTAKPEATEKLLRVNAVPLYGFRRQWPLAQLRSIFAHQDVFVWSGATGLSDYPALAVKILRLAQKCGLKTVVWGVGMDSTLNPAFFKLGGKKLALCKLLSALTFWKKDMVAAGERFLERRMKRQIAQTLQLCDLVVVRDYQTQGILREENANLSVIAGADSAILCDRPDDNRLAALPEAIKNALLSPGENIGLCLSAQRPIVAESALASALDSLLESSARRIIMIPMNPRTDAALMEKFRRNLKHKDKTWLLSDCQAPETILTVASHCRLVISSRLHLLILAANAGVPICGISRGSKVDNFLLQFGLKPSGSVEDTSFAALQEQAESLLANPKHFKTSHDSVYKGLHVRLSNARKHLNRLLASV